MAQLTDTCGFLACGIICAATRRACMSYPAKHVFDFRQGVVSEVWFLILLIAHYGFVITGRRCMWDNRLSCHLSLPIYDNKGPLDFLESSVLELQ